MITIPQNNAGFIGAVISAYSPPQAVVEVANFHCSLLLSLIIAWSSHQSNKTWFSPNQDWFLSERLQLWWLEQIVSSKSRGNLLSLPSWTPGVMTEPSSAVWHEICWAGREWVEHIPSKLAGKCTEMPKNMTWIMIRFVLTVATVIPTERGEKSECWRLQIWWYLEIRASQVNSNKQFGMKSTRNWTSCLHWKPTQKVDMKALWSLFSIRGIKYAVTLLLNVEELPCGGSQYLAWLLSEWRTRGHWTLIANRDITLVII